MSKHSKTDKPRNEQTPVAQQTLTDSAARHQGKSKMKTKEYEKILEELQVELVHLQDWVVKKGLKVCILFEGRDGAGKGGVIKALTERVSPRVFRVTALPVPSDREKSQMYMQRYIPHLPAAGEIAIFDRSWYNRAGVERVMGYCTEKQAKDFLDALPDMERGITASGIILLKYWLEVSMDEQTRRIEDRITDGRKTWKLSPNDLESYNRWYDYSRARDEMFKKSDSAWAPWFIAHSDDKKSTRLNIIKHILSQIPYKKLPRQKIKLPARQKANGYVEPDYPYHIVEQAY